MNNSKILKYLIIIQLFFIIYKAEAQPDINYDSLVNVPLKDLLDLKVTGFSKYEEKSTEAPATVIIITESQIIENCYHDLSEVLKNVPGFDIVDNARGYGEYYIMRGIEGNDRFLILIDGEKINPVSGTFISVGNSIPVNFVEQIEIIFGPFSVMYGADAFAGIINLVSKKNDKKIDVTAETDYGSMNSINGQISLQFKTEKDIKFSFFGKYFQSEGPDFIGKDTVYDAILEYKSPQRPQFEQPIYDNSIFSKLSYKNFAISYFRQDFDEGNAFNQNPERVFYNKECKWSSTNNLISILYHNDFDQKGYISTEISLKRFVIDPETQFYKLKPDAHNNAFNQYMTGKDNSLKVSFTYNYIFLKKLNLISGLEAEYSLSVPPYANDQVLGYSAKFEGENAKIIQNELTINNHRIALFSQISYSFFSQLFIMAGGRVDYSILNKETFNPRMSIIYTPDKNLNFKILYGTAFQSPSLFYQYEQWAAATALMNSVVDIQEDEPNWKLENQKVSTYEVIADYLFDEKYFFQFSTGYSELTNLIERVIYSDSVYNKYFSTPDTTIYSLGFRNENIGKQEIFHINAKNEININKNLYIYLAYSYLDAIAKKENLDENIPRIAKHKFWFGFTQKNIFKCISFSSSIKYFGKINNRNSAVFPSGYQPGYLNIDVILRYNKISKPFSAFIKINNLLNANYSHGGMVAQVIYLPTSAQPGINFHAGIEYRFVK